MTKPLSDIAVDEYGAGILKAINEINHVTQKCLEEHKGRKPLELALIDRIDDMTSEMLTLEGTELLDNLQIDLEAMLAAVKRERERKQ